MSKHSDAKRKAKLKERRRKAEAASARAPAVAHKVAEWIVDHDAQPNIIAELFDEDDVLMAHVQGDGDDLWTVMIGGEPVAGTSDEFAALAMFLNAAIDDRESGETSYMCFSSWLLEEIEARCDAAKIEGPDFLMSLLPPEKRRLALPQIRVM